MLPRLLILAGSLGPATGAAAFVGTPSFEPSPARPGEGVVMHVTAGECHALSEASDRFDVVVTERHIEVIVDGIAEQFTPFCDHPEVRRSYPLGTFPPGIYEVSITVRDDLPVPDTLYPGVASASLVVSAPGRAHIVPVSSMPLGVTLVAAIALLALARSRRAG